MKNLPIGIQTFSEIINDNYLYIDKTRDIYNLFAHGGKYYFLSRPRRFGKSLLLSTLKEIFSGHKELFRGLWIYDKIQWKAYPIIYLDFLGLKYNNSGELCKTLEFLINQNAKSAGIQLKESGYDKRFNELIQKLANKGKVVILVDEYDKPIISNIENKDIAKENRDILRTFYEAIKSSDEYVKFVFITGVSKFFKVSIFSGLNNLNDISIDDKYSTFLGYTDKELKHYFKDRLGTADGQKLDNIKRWYNGYSWDGEYFVYNPLSILLYFDKDNFRNYWFSTGTPTFLVNTLKESDIPVIELEKIETDDSILESFDIENIDVTALLFQTGYLTIKEKTVTADETIYRLSYPNKEVRESFLKHLLIGFTGQQSILNFKILRKLKSSIHGNDLNTFFNTIHSLFASIPYNLFIGNRESYYSSIIYLLLQLAGISVEFEKETNIGRIDAISETENHIYIMEFKMGTSEEALAQIKEKKYYEPYLNSSKSIILVGIGIDSGERNITDYKSALPEE